MVQGRPSCPLRSPSLLWDITNAVAPGRASLAFMIGKVGDIIIIESERADATGRRGVIEEVFQEQPPRYQVHWEDGHTSILSPAAGCARIEQKKRPHARTKA
jgi:hypothetical protein